MTDIFLDTLMDTSGVQYCLASEKAVEHIRYTEGDPEIVSYPEYNAGLLPGW